MCMLNPWIILGKYVTADSGKFSRGWIASNRENNDIFWSRLGRIGFADMVA